MRLRWFLFLVLSGSHAALLVGAPTALAPAVAATVFVPLALLHAAGIPAFTAAPSGGWPAPSLLGWVVVIALWAGIWWGVASILSRIRKSVVTNG